MDTALPQKFPFILDRNLAKANCTGNRVCTACDTVVLVWDISTCSCTNTAHQHKTRSHKLQAWATQIIRIVDKHRPTFSTVDRLTVRNPPIRADFSAVFLNLTRWLRLFAPPSVPADDMLQSPCKSTGSYGSVTERVAQYGMRYVVHLCTNTQSTR